MTTNWASFVSTLWGAVGGGVSGFLVGLFRDRSAAKSLVEDIGDDLCGEARAYWRTAGPSAEAEAQLTRLSHKFQSKARKFARKYVPAKDRVEVDRTCSAILRDCTGEDFGTETRIARPAQVTLLNTHIERLSKQLDAGYIVSTLRSAIRIGR